MIHFKPEMSVFKILWWHLVMHLIMKTKQKPNNTAIKSSPITHSRTGRCIYITMIHMYTHSWAGVYVKYTATQHQSLLMLWGWQKLFDLLGLGRLSGADSHSRPWKLKVFQTELQALPILKERTDNLDVSPQKQIYMRDVCRSPDFMTPFSFSSPSMCTFTGLYFCGVFRQNTSSVMVHLSIWEIPF